MSENGLYENAYCSGTHIVSAGEWLELDSYSDTDSYFEDNPEYTKAIFAIGRGGKKPRKDLCVWKDVRDYADFFFDNLFEIKDAYPENFAKTDIKLTLEEFAFRGPHPPTSHL